MYLAVYLRNISKHYTFKMYTLQMLVMIFNRFRSNISLFARKPTILNRNWAKLGWDNKQLHNSKSCLILSRPLFEGKVWRSWVWFMVWAVDSTAHCTQHSTHYSLRAASEWFCVLLERAGAGWESNSSKSVFSRGSQPQTWHNTKSSKFPDPCLKSTTT